MSPGYPAYNVAAQAAPAAQDETFLALLLVDLVVAIVISAAVVRLFDPPVRSILRRLQTEELGGAWARYVAFAGLVAGVSGGVSASALERYIMPRYREQLEPLVLTNARWTFEVYRVVISSLSRLAWMYLSVFMTALLAFVVLRAVEVWAESRRVNPGE